MNDVLHAVWNESEGAIAARVALIERAVEQLIDDQLGETEREQARRAAHMLAGALGIFGFERAGTAALCLEAQLERGDRPGPERARLLREELGVLHEMRTEGLEPSRA